MEIEKEKDYKPIKIQVKWDDGLLLFVLACGVFILALSLNTYNQKLCNNFYIKQISEKCFNQPLQISVYGAQNLNITGNLTIWNKNLTSSRNSLTFNESIK